MASETASITELEGELRQKQGPVLLAERVERPRDLAVRGIPVVVLDDSDTVGARGLSSRGVNFARRSLEIWDRLGMGDRVVEKGVVWNVHCTYLGPDTIYAYEMNPDPD